MDFESLAIRIAATAPQQRLSELENLRKQHTEAYADAMGAVQKMRDLLRSAQGLAVGLDQKHSNVQTERMLGIANDLKEAGDDVYAIIIVTKEELGIEDIISGQ